MSEDTMRVTFDEPTAVNTYNAINGFIDDFYASVDVTHTPFSMKISIRIIVVIQNAGGDEKEFPLSCYWEEDATVINTRMKAIVTAFILGINSMEAASSYTTVQNMHGSVVLTIAS